MVRAGVMQPYFFPYIGYFALIQRSDVWVVFDVTQYTPKTWMNRNRVLHPTQSWNWVTVPLANSTQSITISEAQVLDAHAARASILGKLSHYRRRAPYWRAVEDLVEAAFEGVMDTSLVSLNVSALAAVCRYLDITFEPLICSRMGLDLSTVDHAGGWAPLIASNVGASHYLNPIGGASLFNEAEFGKLSVALEFLEFPPFTYETDGYTFEPNLSVLDVLMWNAPATVRETIAEASIRPAVEVLGR